MPGHRSAKALRVAARFRSRQLGRDRDIRTISFCRAFGILRNNLTAYDAAYVALAEALGAPLLTRDRHLAAAAGHRAQIELV